MAASEFSRASSGEIVPARKASTREQASRSQGSSVMVHDATGNGSVGAGATPPPGGDRRA